MLANKQWPFTSHGHRYFLHIFMISHSSVMIVLRGLAFITLPCSECLIKWHPLSVFCPSHDTHLIYESLKIKRMAHPGGPCVGAPARRTSPGKAAERKQMAPRLVFHNHIREPKRESCRWWGWSVFSLSFFTLRMWFVGSGFGSGTCLCVLRKGTVSVCSIVFSRQIVAIISLTPAWSTAL